MERKHPFNFVDKEHFIYHVMDILQNQLIKIDELIDKASNAEAKEEKYGFYLQAAEMIEKMSPLAPLYLSLVPEEESEYIAKTFDELQGLLEDYRKKQQH